MIRRGIMYSVASAFLALAIGLLGAWIAGEEGRSGVVAAVAVAYVVQVLLFWILVVVLRLRPLSVYLLGAIGRGLLLGVMAFLVVPIVGWEAESTLISLVAVLFATTLLEPVYLRTVPLTKR